jgi:hypothetical protein
MTKLILALLVLLALSCRDQPEARSNTKPNGVQVREPVLIADTVLHPNNSKTLNKIFSDCRDSIKRKNQHKKKMTFIWCDSLDTCEGISIWGQGSTEELIVGGPALPVTNSEEHPFVSKKKVKYDRPFCCNLVKPKYAQSELDSCKAAMLAVINQSENKDSIFVDGCGVYYAQGHVPEIAQTFDKAATLRMPSSVELEEALETKTLPLYIDGAPSPGVVSGTSDWDHAFYFDSAKSFYFGSDSIVLPKKDSNITIFTGPTSVWIDGVRSPGVCKPFICTEPLLDPPHSTRAYRTAFNGAVKKDTLPVDNPYLVSTPSDHLSYIDIYFDYSGNEPDTAFHMKGNWKGAENYYVAKIGNFAYKKYDSTWVVTDTAKTLRLLLHYVESLRSKP